MPHSLGKSSRQRDPTTGKPISPTGTNVAPGLVRFPPPEDRVDYFKVDSVRRLSFAVAVGHELKLGSGVVMGLGVFMRPSNRALYRESSTLACT